MLQEEKWAYTTHQQSSCRASRRLCKSLRITKQHTNKEKHLPNKNPTWLKVINKSMDQIIIFGSEYSLVVKDIHGLEARVQSPAPGGKMSRVKEMAQLVKYLQHKKRIWVWIPAPMQSMAADL